MPGPAEVTEVAVKDLVQRAWCRADGHGLGGDHVRAAGPGAAQGDRMRSVPHEPQHVSRGQCPGQRTPNPSVETGFRLS